MTTNVAKGHVLLIIATDNTDHTDHAQHESGWSGNAARSSEVRFCDRGAARNFTQSLKDRRPRSSATRTMRSAPCDEPADAKDGVAVFEQALGNRMKDLFERLVSDPLSIRRAPRVAAQATRQRPARARRERAAARRPPSPEHWPPSSPGRRPSPTDRDQPRGSSGQFAGSWQDAQQTLVLLDIGRLDDRIGGQQMTDRA